MMPLCRAGLMTLSNYSKFVIQKHDQETQPRSHSSSASADMTSPVKYFQYLSCSMRKLRMTSYAALEHIHCQTNIPCLFITLTTRPEHYIVNIRLFQADLAIKHVVRLRFVCTPSTTVPFASRWSLEALVYQRYFGVFFPGFVFALLQRVHRQKKT